jgi:rhamnosyltransferase
MAVPAAEALRGILAGTAVIVPVRNGGALWRSAAAALREAAAGLPVLVVDSSSSDGSDQVATAAGFRLLRIAVADFNHGRTRQWAISQLEPAPEFAVFLTQDAVLQGRASLESLLACFADPAVAAVYGRQLPHENARPLGRHARLYNYPERSDMRSLADAGRLGVKLAFLSNSYSAFRTAALQQVGGFPGDLIMGEDTIAAARLLFAGHKVGYCAEAMVRHSHDYSLGEEFRRYFDTGVLHVQAAEFAKLPRAEGEGRRFVVSELRYLLKHAPWLIPGAILRTAVKLLGYRLGRAYRRLPRAWRPRLSMTPGYWAGPHAVGS